MAARRNAQYTPLPADDYDGAYGGRNDPRIQYRPDVYDKIPWKSIALAIILLLLGSLLRFLSFFVFTGHMVGEKSQAYGLLVPGILSFMPGVFKLHA